MKPDRYVGTPSFLKMLLDSSKEKNIDIIDFIDIKGWKASGNKIPSFLRISGFLFLDGESEIEDEEIIDNHTQPAINEDSTNDDLTLF